VEFPAIHLRWSRPCTTTSSRRCGPWWPASTAANR